MFTSYTELTNESYSNKATSILTKNSNELPYTTVTSLQAELYDSTFKFDRQTAISTTFPFDIETYTTESFKSMLTGSSYTLTTHSLYSETDSVWPTYLAETTEFLITTIITELIDTESTETIETSPIITDKQCQTEVTGNITTTNETFDISSSEYLTTEEYDEFTTILYDFLITEENDEFEFRQNVELNNKEFIKNGMSLLNFPDLEI